MVAWKTNSLHLHTVLIVSNDLEMMSVWKTLYEQRSCSVAFENSPQAALRSAALLSPALILLHLDLPQLEKLRLCRSLRATTNGAILLLSPSHETEYLFEYARAGVNEHIHTPAHPMTLLNKSMAWLVLQEWTWPTISQEKSLFFQ